MCSTASCTLLTMQQLIKGLDGAGILARHIAPLQDKLQTMLGTSDVEARELMKRVRIAQPTRRPVALQARAAGQTPAHWR